MKKRLAICLAIACLFGVTTPAHAQEMLLLPAGLHQLDLAVLEQAVGKQFTALAVTLPPEQSLGRLYLDGEPLEAYRTLSREEAARVVSFCSARAPVSIGVSATPETAAKPALRIRCINPVF